MGCRPLLTTGSGTTTVSSRRCAAFYRGGLRLWAVLNHSDPSVFDHFSAATPFKASVSGSVASNTWLDIYLPVANICSGAIETGISYALLDQL